MFEPTYRREKTIEKIVLAIEKIAKDNPNPVPLTDQELADRRAKIDEAFRKFNEKN